MSRHPAPVRVGAGDGVRAAPDSVTARVGR